MKSIVGVFESYTAARDAAESLPQAGIDPRHIRLLAPGSSESAWNRVPTTGTEQSGMGNAVGSVVGGAVGAAAGMPLGAALASLLLPGVGPIVAMGIAGAALLGAGGVAAGAAIGRSVEDHIFTGVPEDEVFFYEDALRRGRAVLIAFVEDDEREAAARRVMQQTGAESLDAARESWWMGLRGAEQEHYEANGEDFHHDERTYRHGFEAAVRPGMRGKPYEAVVDDLLRYYPDASETCFRRGYERGQAHFSIATMQVQP
jgi:hypothetical protein